MSSIGTPSPYPHWMLKEICEQPKTISSTLVYFVAGVTPFKEEAVEPIRKRLRAQRHCGQRIEPPRFAEVITLQLLSYFVAMYSGIDVDHPRNLVKAAVTE
jgi:glucosamine 6-phosphate synthetase-like amidotransferase/phosphosugar isomerase protein